MKKHLKTLLLFPLLLAPVISLNSCQINFGQHDTFLSIVDDDLTLLAGGSYQLSVRCDDSSLTLSYYSSDISVATIDQKGTIRALKPGETTISVKAGSHEDSIKLIVIESQEIQSISLTLSKNVLNLGESGFASYEVTPSTYVGEVKIEETNEKGLLEISGDKITAVEAGTTSIYAILDDVISNVITIEITDTDPYDNIDIDEFYENYHVATSAYDAKLRSEHYLMSGEITVPDPEPEISRYQPQDGGKLIKNSSELFSEDGDTYYVVNSYGEVVKEIYRDGAYITLEDVAAYVYAFGEIPANYVESKQMDPEASPWGEYLRLNLSTFSGDTDKYPYEPELPRIQGCGGDLYYYEIDIGTTGTRTSSHISSIYNNGYYIDRGAARIVFSRRTESHQPITNFEDRYVFYTYNHYNDFQEYLNYENGWGKIFGNETGGGKQDKYSSKYPPTPYVDVKRENLALK